MGPILTITKFTFHQLIRSKVLLNTILIGMGLFLVSFISHEISYGARSKITLDIGLGLNYLSIMVISLFMGSGLLSSEIENRTLYMSLSRPIERWHFFIGKVFGMSAILALNSLILSIFIIGAYLLIGGDLSPLIFLSIFFDFLSALIILSLVIFFSLFSNQIIAILMTLCVAIAGNFLNQLSVMNFVMKRLFLSYFVEGLKWILPNLNMLDLKELVIYFNSISQGYILKSALYVLFYLIFINLLSCMIFEKKNLD